MTVGRIIDLDEPATQSGFGALVGISQQAVSDAITRGVLVAGGTYAEWLLAYSAHMREQAAGRGGDDQGNLTKARARQAIADATLKELQYRREIRDVIAVAELEPSLITWIVGIRSAVENLAARLVALIESKHGIEIDTADVDDLVCTALDAIADYPRFSEDAACKAEPACAQASADADAGMAA